MLPKEAIREFRMLHKKETGIELSEEDAIEKANKFFNFMKTITKPIRKLQNDNPRKS